MTYPDDRKTRIQADRRTYIQSDHPTDYSAPDSRAYDINREPYTTNREPGMRGPIEDNLVNQTPTVGNGQIDVNEESYREGYVRGRVEEHRIVENTLKRRDNDNAARGLLLGIILASLLGLVIAAIFFAIQQNRAPAPVQPVPVPAEPNTDNEPADTPVRERIIERTREEVVPVPVPQPVDPEPVDPEPVDPEPVDPEPQGTRQFNVEPAPTAQPQAPQPQGTQPQAPQSQGTEPGASTQPGTAQPNVQGTGTATPATGSASGTAGQ